MKNDENCSLPRNPDGPKMPIKDVNSETSLFSISSFSIIIGSTSSIKCKD